MDLEAEAARLDKLSPEARATELIRRATRALVPGGQLVLADYFADDRRTANPFAVQMGLTMLASTERGGMLTHGQVRGWLHDAGLQAIRLLEPIGFNQVFVADAPRSRPATPETRSPT